MKSAFRVIDAHCDTLTAPGPLVNARNVSRLFPFLQFYAVCTAERPLSPDGHFAEAINCYDRFRREWDGVTVTDAASLEAALAAPRGAILTLEGADGIRSEEDLAALYERGLRVINPVWNRANRFASANPESGTPADRGLTGEGRRLVRLCEEKRILIDVSHLSDRGFSDLSEWAERPFFASHSDCRAIAPHPRNLTDEQMKTLFSLGGMMGFNLYPPFLTGSSEARLSDLFRHIDHALSLGGENAIGWGLDIDGVEIYPADAPEDASIHDRLFELSLARYGAELTEKLFHRNFAAFLRRHFSR